MKKSSFLLFGSAVVLALGAAPAAGQDRYGERPPVVVSPDLSAPWLMQLGHSPRLADQGVRQRAMIQQKRRTLSEMAAERRAAARSAPAAGQSAPDRLQTAAIATPAVSTGRKYEMDPIYLPQQVDYEGPHGSGTIIIDSEKKFLYLVEGDGKARRYGVGVGKEGFGWNGTHKISRKAEWPDWRPPAQMIERERKKGRILPVHMKGGPENPLGARALYLGSTLYRIHGTNAPWTIGTRASSGCIRMRNEDVVDLYERVKVGTKVVVM